MMGIGHASRDSAIQTRHACDTGLHDSSDRASVLHYGHSSNSRLLQGQAWLRMSGLVAESAGLRHCCARRTGDSLPLRRTSAANPDKYADELLDAYLFVEDADALYAQYAARGVEFTRGLANMPWHSREFAVKDCDGRLLAFGANLQSIPGAPSVSLPAYAQAGNWPSPTGRFVLVPSQLPDCRPTGKFRM